MSLRRKQKKHLRKVFRKSLLTVKRRIEYSTNSIMIGYYKSDYRSYLNLLKRKKAVLNYNNSIVKPNKNKRYYGGIYSLL